MESIHFTKKEKKKLIRIILAISFFVVVFVLDKSINLANVFRGEFNWLLPFFLYLIIYFIIGYDILIKSIKNILHGQIFDENFLMVVATIGAFTLAIYRGIIGETIEGFDEACAVMIFYQVGEFFQSYATNKSRKSISKLMDIRPDVANVKRNGEIQIVDPTEVALDEIIVVNPGEKIPIDGIIVSGQSSLDTKALTGESMPREVSEGDEVISGSINLTTTLEIKVTKIFYDSTVSKILDLVENASSEKSEAENFITKFSKFYTPIVCLVALILAIVPSLIWGNISVWIYRALSFLVVSCPCALVISIPLSFFVGLGTCSKFGILVKGSNYLEKINSANIFIFDKTGTLTKGNFKVANIFPKEKEDEVLKLASICEQGSSHPIAKSILEFYQGEIDENYTITNIAGQGIIARNGNDIIYCGNEKLMNENNISFKTINDIGTKVYVAKNQEFVGSILILDEIKQEAFEVITDLKDNNCKAIMLTGDNEIVAKNVSMQLGLTEYKSSLLPEDKVVETKKIIDTKNKNDVVCFVGDGINDAPVLMLSDVGISMGGVGSDAAIEASDIVLMKDDLKGISLAKKIAKKTMSIVFQNIIFSISIKFAILLLTAFGITNMWLAVFGDVGVAVLAILNAMRVNLKQK